MFIIYQPNGTSECFSIFDIANFFEGKHKIGAYMYLR